jgi:hypothetical protein
MREDVYIFSFLGDDGHWRQLLALENVKSFQGFGDFKQRQEKVERCQIT